MKYTERMLATRGRGKEVFYKEIAPVYRVHYNIIRKVCKRWRLWDFEPHKSTRKDNLWHHFKNYVKAEKKIFKRLKREEWIERYEKEMAGELVHIDVHKRKNIKWENPKKKKYIAWVIDDATRMKYGEELPNKKAKTLAWFIKRAYKWFQAQWVTIKKLLSDNGLEFTTHHIHSRPKHSFEMMLKKLNIVHKYTRVRRPQTNGKIERFWRIFEEQFFQKYTFSSNKDFNMKFKDWLVFYNTKRKHWWIQFMTPMQKLEILLEKNKVCL